MKSSFPIAVLAALLISGCDTIYGVRRAAKIQTLPDLQQVKAKIESYPEINEVKFRQTAGSQPITLTGLKKAEEVFYLYYAGGENIRGTLMFIRNYKGEVSYDQSLYMMHRHPPQPWIDATWPVMKRIERDLEESFGCPEIKNTLQTNIHGVENPERLK
jgi:hypothetical protein